MSLALLTPWQQLLWIVCAAILIVPLVAAGINAVIRGYFRAKEEHFGKIAKAFANVLSEISESTLKKFEEQMKKAKENEVKTE